MIGRIEGQLVEVSDNVLLVAVAGVGYEVEVSHGVLAALPGRDHAIRLYTHFVVREDAQQLYGFASRDERDLFRALIRVNGVGPKLALALISSVSLAELAGCVETGEPGVLTRVPGIGRRTAERLLIELKDKIPETAVAAVAPAPPARDAVAAEAQRALEQLGYRPAEAAHLVQEASADADTVEGLVRAALKAAARQAEAAS
ncbi:MAG: Holliday junction branch migration protein RuvA [Pseudomonadota bacterium]